MTVGRPTPVPARTRLTAGDARRVAAGGAAGAVVRWAVVTWAASSSAFPWPTLLVNLVGCLVVGMLFRSPRSTVMLLGVGFAGGLTTFSTFAVEVAALLDGTDPGTAVAYVVTSVLGGVAAVVVGGWASLRW